ncbi:hypothetical protein BDR06DRAFT_1015461 [Suillus hirtellus]|nr:hypothetical protein BDR06DRAFT_1015461 [Suillus hirtellus]
MENTIPNIPVESVSAIVQAVDPNEPPPKRKPGQPKGSGKKQPPDPTIISKRSSIQWVALVKMVYLPDLSVLRKRINSED